jgi:hypothetical protein
MARLGPRRGSRMTRAKYRWVLVRGGLRHDAINAGEINRWVFMVGGRGAGVGPQTLASAPSIHSAILQKRARADAKLHPLSGGSSTGYPPESRSARALRPQLYGSIAPSRSSTPLRRPRRRGSTVDRSLFARGRALRKARWESASPDRGKRSQRALSSSGLRSCGCAAHSRGSGRPCRLAQSPTARRRAGQSKPQPFHQMEMPFDFL